MTDEVPTPPGTRTERPRWKLVAIMVLGGIVLAVGGCGFFLSELNLNSSSVGAVEVVGGIAFAVGCISFLIGGLTGLVYMVQALFRRKS